jgi:predicted hydrocarbon binding protein
MAKGAKTRKVRTRVRSKTRPRKVPVRKTAGPAIRSGSELLIRKMLDSEKGGERELLIQDLIYNASRGLKNLAYRSGFELGKEIYENSDRTIGGLEKALENAGFGRVLYSPFESYSTITAYKVRPRGRDLGADVHAFEAGLIAGYLSAHAGRAIHVKELRCTYNGSDSCNFVASAADERDVEREKVADLGGMMEIIRENIGFAGNQGTGGSYYLLFAKPLLKEPVLTEASKLMYLTGKRIAEASRAEDFDDRIIKMSRYLGIESARVKRRRGRGVEINLTYSSSGSISNFVDLTTSMLAGFAKGVLNKNVYVQRRLNGRRKYSVSMKIAPKKSQEKKA